MKLLVEPKSDRVVGLHMIGADAAEIVQGFAVAIKCGATKAQFDATIGIHPSSAEEFVTMRTKRWEEHTSELQSLMRISYAVFCLKTKKIHTRYHHHHPDRT